jgi:hypothetical protein
MDKLPEPSFERDSTWPRRMLGVEEGLKTQKRTATIWFVGLSALSISRFWREITVYKKNYPLFLAVIVPTFLFTSYNLAQFLKVDPYYLAAELNNQNEEKYIINYKALYLEAKRKNIQLPDNLIL